MRFVVTIAILIIVLIAITFSLQNTDTVSLRYYDVFNTKVSSYLLMFICFFSGVVLAGLLGVVERVKMRRTITKLKREIKSLENEIYEIRKGQLAADSPPALKKEYLS